MAATEASHQPTARVPDRGAAAARRERAELEIGVGMNRIATIHSAPAGGKRAAQMDTAKRRLPCSREGGTIRVPIPPKSAMPQVSFTANLQRHLAAPARLAAGETVRQVLEFVFAANPRLRSYILDDQDRLRKHVVIYVNDARIADRDRLSDPVGGADEIFVFQALSGG